MYLKYIDLPGFIKNLTLPTLLITEMVLKLKKN